MGTAVQIVIFTMNLMPVYFTLFFTISSQILNFSEAGLLGAGTGAGSCLAPPFRSKTVEWADGCPQFAPCCSEYGYCHSVENWIKGRFRDCNQRSNGTPLPLSVLKREYLEILLGRSNL